MVAPAASISARTPGALCAARLSSTTMSPGRSWRTRCRRTPGDEPRCRHGAPRRGERHPAVQAHGPDQAQVVAPVARARLDQFLPARQPRVRPAHRHIRARFVEKDQALGLYRLGPDAERRALGLDARPILLGRPRSFFLQTYPVRRSARQMLERCTRPYGATRLYARVSSSHVWSGLASINGLSTAQATGDTQPPPLASGSTVPVSRCRCTQRINVAGPISKRAAMTGYGSVRDSYARTARTRSSRGYGFGMHVIDHKYDLHSSENWG